MIFRISISFLLLGLGQLLVAQPIVACTSVFDVSDINRAIQLSTSNVILLCPFSISFNPYKNENPIQIDRDGTRFICAKRDINDKCSLFGDAARIEVLADDVTIFGFDFIGSEIGAVSVKEAKGITIIDCNFTNNRQTSIENQNGGSIQMSLDQARNVLVFQSLFVGNTASNGGAIYGDSVSIVSSTFTNNFAIDAYGGGVFQKSGYIRDSNFTSNGAKVHGPTIYSENDVCDAGMNYACQSLIYQTNSCDGIFGRDGHCSMFGYTCEHYSASPSIGPSHQPTFPTITASPSILPTTRSTLIPSSHPTSYPSSHPTSIPSSHPSLYPSSKPSKFRRISSTKAPSISPIQSKKNAPSFNPSPSRTSSSKSPTITLSMQPQISNHSTTFCNMNITQKIGYIENHVSRVNETTFGPLQSEVLEWVLTSDDSQFCPKVHDIIQRYAAAVVSKSFSSEVPLTSEHECNWNGFSCNLDKQIVSFTQQNTLTNQLPSELSLLVNLRQILIKKGEITGTIPSSIFQIPSLQRLDLDKNSMSGEIKIHTESAIQRLDINFNNFTGNINFLTSFPNITEAHLDNNNFTGVIPSSLGNLTNLFILTLHGNSLTGTMPESICNLRKYHNLKYLMADCDGDSPKVQCECCTHCSPYRKK